MLITRIELENIKSYRQVGVDFRHGTTAISGANGAGKTTLVEAIGYALFDYLPYSQTRFVREGEKYGRVVVHLLGGDDRPYIVERRCGSGSRWFIIDSEASMRIEQSADVLDKLHELFGIDRERPLDSLFRDALGVPQGTFTSIFLETGSKRKQTFDALLQIEDYKTAAEYLLKAQNEYKEQIQTQQSLIKQLEFETRELETWRENLLAARQLDEQQKTQYAEQSQQLQQHELRFEALKQQEAQLKECEHIFTNSRSSYEHHQSVLHDREMSLQAARRAQQIVTESSVEHQRYLQARETLEHLRKAERKRNTLRQQQATLQKTAATSEANMKNWQGRLADVATARQRLSELLPQVEQQQALEQQRDDLMQQVTRYNAIVDEDKRLSKQLTMVKEKQEGLQKRITEIEPLEPLANLLSERSEQLTQLRLLEKERSGKYRQFQEKREQLREKLLERDQVAEKLRKAERNVEVIEEHRIEAEEMPTLQEQLVACSAQRHRLEGNIEGYRKSREQSAGGQCPLLHETCLNIKGRGLVSLEFYFDGLLKEEHAQLTTFQQQQATITERMAAIKKFVDALGKLGQYIERRDGLAEHLQRIAHDINRLERDVADLSQELEALKQVEQQIVLVEAAYHESKRADVQVRELAGLYKQVQQLQEQTRQYEQNLSERRQEAKELQGSEAQLKQVKTALEQLRDPRARSQTQQSIVDQEGIFQQHLQAEDRQWQETQQQLQHIGQQLIHYESLDADIGLQEATSQASLSGYQNYLKNETEAHLLPEREAAYQQQLNSTQEAERTLQTAEQTYNIAKAAFDQAELVAVSAEITRLRSALAGLAESMQHHQKYIQELGQKIAHAEELHVQLEAAQQEQQTLEDLSTMMKQFRELIKEAAPHVLKAMLGDISAEANRIFGEIMGDRGAQLSWQNDYEIVLRRQSINRTFAQLSGGEQMSAALSVRLALLKKLSTLNIAFFDEPTQNMDELRRINLAEQIRRVRGFEQLIVISHDDTFEQGLDSLVRLRKTDGATQLVGEEELHIEQREQSYAS
jgi:exonuclease SbcC